MNFDVIAASFPPLVESKKFLWADDKSKPYKELYWGLSLAMVSKLISIEKPKVATMATHLKEHGFTWDHSDPQTFFLHLDQSLSKPDQKSGSHESTLRAWLSLCYN